MKTKVRMIVTMVIILRRQMSYVNGNAFTTGSADTSKIAFYQRNYLGSASVENTNIKRKIKVPVLPVKFRETLIVTLK